MTHSSPTGTCPHCGRPLPTPPSAQCPQCALPLTGTLFDRLRWVDGELHRLDRRRGTLFAYRHRLLDEWRAGAASGAAAAQGPGAAGTLPPPPHAGGPGWPAAAGVQRPEASPRTARNVLLVLGGVLLTVAALAFTLLSWGSMGIGGRAAVLATVTLLTTALPAVLLRRALHATAEAVAGVGLVLLLLDAYALRQVSLQDTDPLRYTAGAVAVVAVLWAAYGLLLGRSGVLGRSGGAAGPGLRVPVPAAVVLGQLPVPLWAVSAGAGTSGTAWSLLATAAADVLLAVLLSGRPLPAVRTTAGVTALLTGAPALLLAAWLSVQAEEPPAAARAGALLLTAAGVLLLAARREKAPAAPLGCTAGVLLIAASGGLVRTLVPSDTWVVPGYLLCAVALAGVVVELPSAAVRVSRRSPTAGLLTAAGLMHGIAVLYGAPAVTQALLEPLGWAVTPWQGAPWSATHPALAPGRPWTGDAGTPVLFAVPALALAAATRLPGRPGLEALRRPAAAAALALACATAVVTPLALGLPYAAVTCCLVVLVAALLALSAAVPAVSLTATLAALATGLTATGWALADRTATFLALTVLGAAFATTTWRTVAAPAAAATDPDAPAPRSPSPDPAEPAEAAAPVLAGRAVRSALCAATAVLCAAGLARALPAALGVPAEQAAFAVLALAAATAPLAARLGRTRPRPGVAGPLGTPSGAASLAVECAGYATAGWALALSATSAPLLALALGLCGVTAGGVALREDRRPAGYVATALFLLATWVRLYASEVSVPEAYALPLAVAAFAVGVLRARRSPGTSSWTAYGPALSCALLPSLVMIWGDPHWVRPLLLGVGSLAVTLLGARLRLRAPLLVGGGVLVLVAGHELAPYVTQVIGMLPRWLPPALAGLLLLAVGATYEHRLHDARRLRAAWRRLG